MKRGHSLISLNLWTKNSLADASLNWLYNYSGDSCVPPMNYGKRLHRPVGSRSDAERTEPTPGTCKYLQSGCSPFSVLLINIPPRSSKEYGASKAAWYHLLVGVLINPVVSAFSGVKGAGRGSPAETTERMCSAAPSTPLNPSSKPDPPPPPPPPVPLRPFNRPTGNPLPRSDPQPSTPDGVPPAWMSRDRPAANQRPLMSGCAPCRRLINRPALHRRPVQLRGSHPG